MYYRRLLLAVAISVLCAGRADSWVHGKWCDASLLSANTTGFIGWSSIDGTITPGGGAAVPGGTSARFVEGSSAASDHLVFFEGTGVTPNKGYRYLVWARPVTSPNNRLAKLQLASAGYTADIDGFFDVRAGTIFFVTPATGADLTLLDSGFIINEGGGWYLIGFTFKAATSTVNILIGEATSGGNGTYDGDGSSATDYWQPVVCAS